MREDMLCEAIRLIEEEDDACVVIRENGIVLRRKGRGISPVMRLYEEGALEGATVVDKIIGKASAMLLSLAGVAEVYGLVLSEDAASWLEGCSIPYAAGTLTDKILNRTLTGLCPMEITVRDLSDAGQAYLALKAKLEELAGKSHT